MRKRISTGLLSLSLLLLTGCLFSLPNGSGIRMSLDHVPVAEMPANLPPLADQAGEVVLGFEDMVLGTTSPVLGALLYQFVFRPLRRRREEKAKVKKE